MELEAPLPSVKLGLRTAHLCIDSLICDVFLYSSQPRGIETQVSPLLVRDLNLGACHPASPLASRLPPQSLDSSHLLSVYNRAVTIKDIANRASCFGLVCQSLEVGVQAVAMYLRARETRCDLQDDYPFLLGRTLLGTPADDDLVNHRIWLMAANVIQYRTSIDVHLTRTFFDCPTCWNHVLYVNADDGTDSNAGPKQHRHQLQYRY